MYLRPNSFVKEMHYTFEIVLIFPNDYMRCSNASTHRADDVTLLAGSKHLIAAVFIFPSPVIIR